MVKIPQNYQNLLGDELLMDMTEKTPWWRKTFQ